jgi:hypothetical protein
MPKVRRRPTAVPPPAVSKKRYDYDDGATDPAAAAEARKAKTPARKAATKK